MRALRWIAALWPGLLSAWMLGSWRGLALASGFAAALNVALIATTIWPRWTLSPPLGAAAWLLVLGLWVYGLFCLRREWPKIAPLGQNDPRVDEWFCAAQQAYLRGHWAEAETLVAKILQRQPHDVESRLLRASLERRTKRLVAARQTLQELRDDATARRWRFEVAAELVQIVEEENDVIAKAA